MYKLYLKENVSSKELLDYALEDYANIKGYELTYNEYKKPYLKDIPLYFSISNTKNITICAISDNEIGVDIEYKQYKEQIKEKAFTKAELELINKSTDKETTFTTMWTIKESFVKMLGIGLSYGLSRVNSIEIKENVQIIDEGNYIISICDSSKFKL